MEQKTEASQAVNALLDDDGENRAVRTFLMQYSCDRSTTVGAMLAHMNRAGWRGYAPSFALDVRPESHLTKAGAQIWIRHLMSLEPAALKAQPAPTEARIPDVLFDGMAVYSEIIRVKGRVYCGTTQVVSDTLDAVVRLLRSAPTEDAQGEDSARLDAALVAAREWIVKNHPALTLSRAKTIDEYMSLLDIIDRARASAETGGVKP